MDLPASSSSLYPPLPTPELVLVPVDALASALLKLGITDISASELLDTVNLELNNTHAINRGEERRNALLRLASQPDGAHLDSIPPYVSVVTQRSLSSSSAESRSEEHRQRLGDIAMNSFPIDQFPEPYSTF